MCFFCCFFLLCVFVEGVGAKVVWVVVICFWDFLGSLFEVPKAALLRVQDFLRNPVDMVAYNHPIGNI